MRLALIAVPSLRSESRERIQAIRRQYDPLYERIAPHVTLVFPADIGDEAEDLFRFRRIAAEQAEITLGFDRIEAATDPRTRDTFLYLQASDGRDVLIDLHRRLNSSAALPRAELDFTPHITLGRFDDGLRATRVAGQLDRGWGAIRGIVRSLQAVRLDYGRPAVIADMPLRAAHQA
jgi:2'-5' RNA ligase